jgi:hypothetical protein
MTSCITVQPGTICKSFQSACIPFSRKMAVASLAIASKPPVARARMVGPAPERQMPRRPGCVDGEMEEVTSGKPGI